MTCGECRMVISSRAKIRPCCRTESTSGWGVFDWMGQVFIWLAIRLRPLLRPGGRG